MSLLTSRNYHIHCMLTPPSTRRRRVFVMVWLNVVATIATALVHVCAAVPSAESPSLLRIPLENYDQMQFFATIHVGDQPFRVIFDTGSCDIWVPSEQCDACAGSRRYRHTRRALDTATSTTPPFLLQYGSGTVKGDVMRETLRLGEDLTLHNARIGSVHEQGQEIQKFQTEGIVGLAMDQLARVTTPSLLTMLQGSDDYHLPMVFSLYLSPLPTSTPESQLIFGGVDDALAGDGAVWYEFPVVDDHDSPAFGFWSIYIIDSHMENTHHRASILSNTTADPVAIIDSGTSLVLLPTAMFEKAISSMQDHISSRFRNHSGRYLCRNCVHNDFPDLSFTFKSVGAASQRFVLRGSDYVRCEYRMCSPQLDISSSDVVILGDIFLRAYYTKFDFDHKRVGFACPLGGCTGGVKPPLMIHSDFAQLSDLGAVYLRSAVFVTFALASLWLSSQIYTLLPPSFKSSTMSVVPKQRHSPIESPKRHSTEAIQPDRACVLVAAVLNHQRGNVLSVRGR